MKSISYLVISAVTLLVGSSAQAQISPTELSKRMDYWAKMVPYCAYNAQSTFPSKDNCEDGDSVSLNGLTCAAGDGRPGIFGQLGAQACEAVKNSQSKTTGEWYRSPKKRYEIENNLPTTDEKQSSNDSAQGIWAYIAQRKDVDAFRAWTGWMKNHKEGGIFWPRYCADKHCDFNVNDCPMLDRLAVYLGEGNALCDLPPMISADVAVKAMKAGYDATTSAIQKLPGAKIFAPQIGPLTKAIDDAFVQAIALAKTADEAKEKLETLTRVTMNMVGFVTFIDSYVNSSGPPRQDVAYGAYLLKKYGGFTGPDIDAAAKVVASKEPENAFFQYVALGPSQRMLEQILLIDGIQRCPSQTSDSYHAKTSWIWETEDRQTKAGTPQPWVETMYWDCIFVGNLYESGPIKGVNLPAPPGYAAASQQAEQQLQDTITGTKNLLDALGKILQDLQDPAHPPTPAQVWKLLTDAHDSTIKLLPGPLQQIAPAVPKQFQPPSWLPAPPVPPVPTVKQVVKQIQQHPTCPCHGHRFCPC
jgi:hypothetical protein